MPPAPGSADEARRRWETVELAEELARAAYPSLVEDAAFRRWHVDYLRLAASPGAAAEFFRMLHDTDVSEVLPTIRVPALVLYRARTRDAALRVAAHAGPGEVLVPSTVKDLVAGSGIGFEDRGAHELKRVPGQWTLYIVRA